MIELLVAVFSATFLAQVVRITVPYALAALGGCVSERSGVINIALEGKLLAGAFGAALGAYYGGGVGWGVAGGVAAGVAVGALYGVCVLRFGADQIVTGVAINLLAYGLTRYLLELQFGQAANSPPTPGFEGHVLANPVLWLAAALLVAVAVILARTPWGLRLRAVGDHPEAAATAGVSVSAVRWAAVLAAGALAGLGGAWLALESHAFVAEMSGGRGYIALAAVIMGGWRPARAAAACVLFGGAEALQYELQTSAVGLPAELARILPYALTMVVLAGFIARSRPPAALGKSGLTGAP